MENTQGSKVTKIRTGETLVVESGGTLQCDAGSTVSLSDASESPNDIALADTHIIVGDAAGKGVDVAVSGDASLARTGALTVLSIGGKKIARGSHVQLAAEDTVATGLATVVAVIVSFKSNPTAKQLYAVGDVGNQSGAPAAGSFLLRTFKPTAADNSAPTVATDFTDNLAIDWIAVGT